MATVEIDVKTLIALIQHPMWLIIKEDSLCHERTPGWGANTNDFDNRMERG